MAKEEIGIIGGTGGIGRWFASFFAGAGHVVHCAGRKAGPPLAELAQRCQVVIVAVPIAATAGVIAQVGPLMPAGSLLMDFTSLKERPLRQMLSATDAEVVGCHPLFGPDCPSLKGQNIVLCPGRGDRWLGRIKEIFNAGGARVTVVSAREHDRMMAIVQGMNHLDSILLGLLLREIGLTEADLAPFTTPLFRAKEAMIRKVFEDRPEMFAGIIAGNPYVGKLLGRYEKNFNRLRDLIVQGDTEGLAALLKGEDLP